MQICLNCQDQILGQTLCEFLSHVGHLVLPFDSTCNTPDLLIAEINADNKAELNKTIELHNRHLGVPIIAIVDSCNFLSKDLAVSIGIYLYIRKPVRLAELELMVHRLEEHRANGWSQL